MARVRVLAVRMGGDGSQSARLSYSAQIYDDGNDAEPVWTCIHDHRTPIEAQLCGVQFITDQPTFRRQSGAA